MPTFRLANGEIRDISDDELQAFLLTEEGKNATQIETSNQSEEEVIGPKKTVEPQNFNRFIIPSFEDKNNLKEIPTDANAVYKSLDNKFKDIKPSSLGDKEYEKKSNEIFNSFYEDPQFKNMQNAILEQIKPKVDKKRKELEEKIRKNKIFYTEANKELNNYGNTLFAQAAGNSSSMNNLIKTYEDAFNKNVNNQYNEFLTQEEKEKKELLKDSYLNSIPLPIPDFLKKGAIRAFTSFAEIPSNINIQASQDRINKLQTRLDDITSGRRGARMLKEAEEASKKYGGFSFTPSKDKILQRKLNNYIDEKSRPIKGDPIEYYTKEIQKEKEKFAKNYIDSKEYEPLLEALGNNAFYDEDGITFEDVGEGIGQQAVYTVTALASGGLANYFLEKGQIIKETLDTALAEKAKSMDKNINELSNFEQIDLLQEMFDNNEIDLSTSSMTAFLVAASERAGAGLLLGEGAKFLTKGVIKATPKPVWKAFQKGYLKQGLKNAKVNATNWRNYINPGIRLLGEPTTEGLIQEPLIIAGVNEALKKVKDADGNNLSINVYDPMRLKESFTQAAFASPGISAGARAIRKAGKEAYRGLFEQGSNTTRDQFDVRRKKAKDKFDAGTITEEQYIQEIDELDTVEDLIYSRRIDKFDPKTKVKFGELALEEQKLLQERETLKNSLSDRPFDVKKSEKNKENLANVQEQMQIILAEQQYLASDKTLGKYINEQEDGVFANTTYKNFKTRKAFEKWAKENNLDKKSVAEGLINNENFAGYLPQGEKTFLVTIDQNVRQAFRGKGGVVGAGVAANVVHHEALHVIQQNLDNETMSDLIAELESISKNDSKISRILMATERRLLIDGLTPGTEQYNKEYFTSISDFLRGENLTEENVTVEDAGILAKIGEKLTKFLGNDTLDVLNFENVKSGEDVIPFLLKYNEFNGNPLGQLKLPSSVKTSQSTPDEKEIVEELRLIEERESEFNITPETRARREELQRSLRKIKRNTEQKQNIKKSNITELYESRNKVDLASTKSVLEEINNLIPKTVKTKQDFQNPRVFNDIYESLTQRDRVINNYIRSRAESQEEANKIIDNVTDRLVKFDPEQTRADGTKVGVEGFGEFIFANTRFGKLDARKDLFKESEKTKVEDRLDKPEAKQVKVEDTGNQEISIQESAAQKLATPQLIEKAKKLIPLTAIKVGKALTDKKVEGKKKVNLRDRERNKFLQKQLFNLVKPVLGKGKSFENFLDKNVKNLKNIALDNINFNRGSGISQIWSKENPPSDQEFIDYYLGKDITPDQPASTKSDRKKSLNQAFGTQLGRELILNNKEVNDAFNNDFGIDLASTNIIKSLAKNKNIDFINVKGIILEKVDNNLLSNHKNNFKSVLDALGIPEKITQDKSDKLANELQTAYDKLSKDIKEAGTFIIPSTGEKYELVKWLTNKVLDEAELKNYKTLVKIITGHDLNIDYNDKEFQTRVRKQLGDVFKRINDVNFINKFLGPGFTAPSKMGDGTLKMVDGTVIYEGKKGSQRYGLFNNVKDFNDFVSSLKLQKGKEYSNYDANLTVPLHKQSKSSLTKNGIESLRKKSIENNKALLEFVDKIKEAGVGIDESVALMISMNNNPKGLIRSAGIYDFLPDNILDKDGNAIIKGIYRLEHMTPAVGIAMAAVDYMHNPQGNKADFKKLLQSYRIAHIPIKYDDMVNKVYKQHMPSYFKIGDSSLIRYFNFEIPGFDLKLRELSTGNVYDKNFYKDNTQQKLAKEGIEKTYDTDLASKKLSEEFNIILEETTGKDRNAKYSESRANMLGKKNNPFKFFVPYSAEDYMGLVYVTLGKGKVGEQQLQWYKDNIIAPYARGISEYESAKQVTLDAWNNLKGKIKNTPANLRQEAVRGFDNQNAVRLYIWNKQNMLPEGTAKKDIDAIVKHVEKNSELLNFANQIQQLLGNAYPKPSSDWLAGTITTDIIQDLDNVKRKDFLKDWREAVETVYSKENLNKLKAIYGDNYVEALKDMLYRMATGSNRPTGQNKIANQWLNWLNNSVGGIMFFNSRSALLQTLSAVNYTNFSDNNPLRIAQAFANQPQFWKDFSFLFNSDFLKQRRGGLQTDVNADEIAKAAELSNNKYRAGIAYILKKGFIPTQFADSFAISFGGATFYRNRIRSLMKEGMDQKQAEEQAYLDWKELSEEAQQSSRPDRVSMQQASPLGRVVLAFANTPIQYTRLMKKAILDLKNKRGDWKTNVSKIVWYGAVQNIIFTGLQNALFALMYGDDEEDEKAREMAKKNKYLRSANSIFDTLLRGMGLGGAVAVTAKNVIQDIILQTYGKELGLKKTNRKDYQKSFMEITTLSPPLDSKISKLMSVGRAFQYKQELEKMKTLPLYNINNPALMAAGQLSSAIINLPADRVLQKARNLKLAIDKDTEAWQSIALSLGFNQWDLLMEDPIKRDYPEIFKKKKKKKKKKSRKSSRIVSPIKKIENLPNGVLGKAHKDGTIQIRKGLSKEKRAKVIAHEKKHIRDMRAGKLNYDKNFVYWMGCKYPRTADQKIIYNGKALPNGHKSFPWEKSANKAI